MTEKEKDDIPRFFKADEVAEILRCHIKLVREEIQNGRLKASRIGRAFLIEASDLKKYVDDCVVKPSAINND